MPNVPLKARQLGRFLDLIPRCVAKQGACVDADLARMSNSYQMNLAGLNAWRRSLDRHAITPDKSR